MITVYFLYKTGNLDTSKLPVKMTKIPYNYQYKKYCLYFNFPTISFMHYMYIISISRGKNLLNNLFCS